ncbi:hypothetical protein Poly41_25650 [Novipirellula artificiosorum]|uniref:Uncharacterized protein n=1 Tax=Novipirellula artificiosorum TaxID=2528016 RepID=A0A5C6DY00_9BACT|nr:hypothetical protein Poly41_25650 [Novipirellula artificiosorum]
MKMAKSYPPIAWESQMGWMSPYRGAPSECLSTGKGTPNHRSRVPNFRWFSPTNSSEEPSFLSKLTHGFQNPTLLPAYVNHPG